MPVDYSTQSRRPDVAKAKNKHPPASVDDGSMADEKRKLKPAMHKPNEPDPEEVQYPGYFKGEGSL